MDHLRLIYLGDSPAGDNQPLGPDAGDYLLLLQVTNNSK